MITFGNKLREDVEKLMEAVVSEDNSLSIDDFSFTVEEDFEIKTLDKLRLLTKLGEIVSSSESETDFGLELVNKYLHGKTISFYLNDEKLDTIVYDRTTQNGFDTYDVFKKYPILLKVMANGMVGYLSKNSLGCLIKNSQKKTK